MLKEDTQDKRELQLINTPNKKDIILSDGTSISEKYFTEGNIHYDIDEINVCTINNDVFYICKNTKNGMIILVNKKDGGFVFPYVLSDIDWHFGNGTIKVKDYTKTNPYDLEKYALIDTNFNIIIDWCTYISRGNGRINIVTNENAENLFDTKTKKYILDKWYESIEYLSEAILKIEDEYGEYNIVNEKGEFLFKTASGNPIMANDITLYKLEYESDFLTEDSYTLDCIIVEDSTDYESIYCENDGKLNKIDITYGDAILGKGSYKFFLDTPTDDMILVSTRHEEQYNYINAYGKLQFDKWFSSYDADILEGINGMLITRVGKFNIVSLYSKEPIFNEEDWFDDFSLLDDIYGDGKKYLAIRKGDLCNILCVTDNNDPKSIKANQPMLKKWSNEISIGSDENKNQYIFVTYGDKKYLFISGSLIECDSCYMGNNNIIFIKKGDKWNITFPYLYDADPPGLMFDEWLDDVYDIDSYFPIVKKDGKYTFISTQDQSIQFTDRHYNFNSKNNKYEVESENIIWFDDVDTVDENKDELEFVVYKNGKKLVIDEYGDKIDNDEDL